MRNFVLIWAILLAVSPAVAEPQKLNDAQIIDLLPNIIAVGASARQTFEADGNTLYGAGRPSLGIWRATDGQYCSQWPPATKWVCFDVLYDKEANTITWVDATGNKEVNRIEPR